MTIKEFSILCGTTTQTLRYYDSINLLKPAHVDYLTGYRHYTKEQALLFVKIKNLQEASFSIEEIKELLNKDDEFIYNAIDFKIKEEENKLIKLKNIKESYRQDKKNMLEKIKDIQEQFYKQSLEINPNDEFGISKEEYIKIIESHTKMFELFNNDLNNDTFKLIENINECKDDEDYNPVEDNNYSIVYEYHDFNKTKDALRNTPALISGEHYCIYFLLDEIKNKNISFLSVVLQLLMNKNNNIKFNVEAKSKVSDDGKNHMYLLKKNK